MTLKQISAFYWICRLGGFAAAAERLHTTQSAISIRMQELERSLGVALFDRGNRSARLTTVGKAFLKYAEQLTALTSELQQHIRDPQKLTGVVALGVTEIVAVSWLPTLVTAIHQQCPGVVLRLDVAAAINQMQKLERGAIDIAIVPGPVEDARYIKTSVGSVEFDWMASPELGLPRKTFTPKDLQKLPLLTLAPDSMSYKQLDQWFEENDATIERWDVCNSLGVLDALAAASVGVSYLPRGFPVGRDKQKKLRVLNVEPKLPGLEYFVVFEKRLAQPVARVIATLAQQHSTFPAHSVSRNRRNAPKRSRA
jgi:DNA-binding transcriptional LysR family regulator